MLVEIMGAMMWDMEEFFWSCSYYFEYGQMMFDDVFDIFDWFDVILVGVCGFFMVLDDFVQYQGVLCICQGFEFYVNLWLVCLFLGLLMLFVDKKLGDFDFLCVCENLEGEYVGLGGRVYCDTEYEVVLQIIVFICVGVE